MKNLISYIIELLGGLIILVFAYFTGFYFDVPFYMSIILMFIVYFILDYCCVSLMKTSIALVGERRYIASILVQTLVSWYDIEYFVRFVNIVCKLKSKKDLETVQKYFYGYNKRFQYMALFLYAQEDVKPVIKWFKDTYLNKNLPIDPFFQDIYTSILKNATHDRQRIFIKKYI